MISFSDCRVLDELYPGLTESLRDRQSIHHWPKGDSQTPTLDVAYLSRSLYTRAVTSSNTISGETHSRLANPWPVRVAIQLDTHVGQSTILSNVSRHPGYLIRRDAELKARELSNFAARQPGSQETF